MLYNGGILPESIGLLRIFGMIMKCFLCLCISIRMTVIHIVHILHVLCTNVRVLSCNWVYGLWICSIAMCLCLSKSFCVWPKHSGQSEHHLMDVMDSKQIERQEFTAMDGFKGI